MHFGPSFIPFNLRNMISNNWYEIAVERIVGSVGVAIPIEATVVSFNIRLTLYCGNEQIEPCTVMCVYWSQYKLL